MIAPMLVWGLALLARLSFAASYVDPFDHVACDVYRVGGREVNVCQYENGHDAGGAL